PVQAVVILDHPIIGLSSAALEFQVEAADAPPAPETIQVTNRGGGVLSNLSTMILYPDSGGWLSAGLAGTAAPTELLVQPDPSGLSPGTYMAEVRVSGREAINTPLSLDVTLTVKIGPVSPAHSTGSVPRGTSGEPTIIVVQARDKGGNPVSSGGATVLVTVSGANAAGPITATDAGDGTYTASYTPTVAGPDSVAITMDGTPISDSRFTSTVAAGAASPAHSTANVPDGTVNLPTAIVVQARDGSGNPVRSGGATVLVTVSGANAAGPITATDAGDGTYTASYTPTVAGTDSVAITMDGTPISDSPFTSTVAAGAASPAHSTATVPDGVRKELTEIVVQARDAHGNPVTVGGETVVVTVTGTNDTGPITATDVGDGTYTASYRPHPVRTGLDYVAITMNGTPISGSPYVSTVR
ncbi:MAG: filamin/ABP280 repeat domain-containing protein, partial [Longimicrobiales bacterium]